MSETHHTVLHWRGHRLLIIKEIPLLGNVAWVPILTIGVTIGQVVLKVGALRPRFGFTELQIVIQGALVDGHIFVL